MLEYIYRNYKMALKHPTIGVTLLFYSSSRFIIGQPFTLAELTADYILQEQFWGTRQLDVGWTDSVWVCDLGCMRSRTWLRQQHSCQFECFQYIVTFALYKYKFFLLLLFSLYSDLVLKTLAVMMPLILACQLTKSFYYLDLTDFLTSFIVIVKCSSFSSDTFWQHMAATVDLAWLDRKCPSCLIFTIQIRVCV